MRVGSLCLENMKKVVEQYGIRPNKKLGQSFLVDSGVLRREVAYANVGREDTVLEIGAGIGNLTESLLRQAGQVVAVERDRQFARGLGDLQKRHGHLEVMWGDALEVGWPRFDKVVANLPYQVALPLIFKMLEQRFDRAVLVFQKRLAERICAGVGEKGYCRIGVAIGRVAQVEIVERIKADAFWPRPEVESAVVRIERVKPRFQVPSDAFFKHILKALFARRGEQVRRVLEDSRDRYLPVAISGKVGKKVRNKPVYMLTPREFGEIAQIAWEVVGDSGRRGGAATAFGRPDQKSNKRSVN